MRLVCEVIRVNPATREVIDEEQAVFQSRQDSFFQATYLDETFKRMVAKIIEAFSTYLKNGSGWMLKKVVRLDITISWLNPFKGSSYIPTPDKILRSKAMTNMKNDDDECFKWAIARALHSVQKNAERITNDFENRRTSLTGAIYNFQRHVHRRCLKSLKKTIASHYSCLATPMRVGSNVLFLCMFRDTDVKK